MTETKPSKLQSLNSILKAITVEPPALLFLTAMIMSVTATQTLALEKACRVNLNLSDAICDAVRNQDTEDNAENERIVQEYVAGLLAYRSIIISILPCLLLIFAGGWMDVTGRKKIMIILPVVGDILVQTNNIFNVVFFFQLNVEYLIFSEAVFTSIFGGYSILFLSVFSYIVDITSEKNRTFRMGVVSFCVYIGMPVGTALSGFLLKSFGYLTVYIVSLTLGVINIVYLIVVLSDPERTKEHKEHDNRGAVYFLKTLFSPAHLLNSLKVVFRKTEDNRAVKLCILIGATCFLFGPNYGESAILYMSTRFRFGWDELQFSIYQTYNSIVGVVGSILSIYVICKKLQWHDSILGILSSVSKILASFVYCFAATGLVFYFGPVVDILNGSSFLAIRSICSKSVEPHETAKLISMLTITEVLMPLVYVPLYTTVYIATMGVMPGFVFLMGAALTIPPLLVFIWLLYVHLRTTKMQKLDSKSDSVQTS